jgi:hypothetical protein
MVPTPASHRSLWNPATNLFEVAVVRRKGPNLVIKDLPLETADRLRKAITDALRERHPWLPLSEQILRIDKMGEAVVICAAHAANADITGTFSDDTGRVVVTVVGESEPEPANNGFYYRDSNNTVRTMCHGRNTGGGNPWVWSGESWGWIMKPSLPTFVILPA